MKNILFLGLLLFSLSVDVVSQADCSVTTAQVDLAVNKVSARLQIAGDLWWDGDEGKYLAPFNSSSGITPSSLFAGGIWMGGVDPGGNLKLAVSEYGRSSGDTDYFAGPLSDTGQTDETTCQNWDRFFKITKTDVDEHLALLQKDRNGEINYTSAMLPQRIRGWAAKGNPFFEDEYGFELPDTPQGLADFWDENSDGIYNPLAGDYPALLQRDCNMPVVPDEMIFWIFNDAGGRHTHTFSDPLRMEVQVMAFAFDRDDDFGFSTFYRYKLINRSVENLTDAYLGLWVDADLGCHTDDYMGCDTTRNMWYAYNEDDTDGESGCSCPGGINTYCTNIPMLAVDLLRSPLDSEGDELGMTGFTYYNNASSGTNPAYTTDPQTAQEYYNYLTGNWRDGTPQGINGYSFPSRPDCTDPGCVSMCSSNLESGDRRVVQSVGPMDFLPGSVNELIFGVIWTPDVSHPCPDLSQILNADDYIQRAFDNCLQDLVSAGEHVSNTANLLEEVRLSPNPFSIKSGLDLTVMNLPRESHVLVFDLDGKVIANLGQAENETLRWSPSNALAPGIYFVEVQNEKFGKRVLKWVFTK